jgi:hypothetical protein
MNIRLYEPERLDEGFFHVIYSALLKCKNARLVSDPRPLPRILKPREHTSAWADFDGHPVFFDMNDHVFFYDIPALDHCEVYFKANLNWDVTEKVLREAGRLDLKSKILPIFFFSPNPARDRQTRRLNWFRNLGRPRYDICHIVGVYRNYVKEGIPSPFEDQNTGCQDPAAYHFWIRHHTQMALKAAFISGYYRLTSRGNRDIEDNSVVFPNLTAWPYSSRIIDGRLTMVNTLPHAVLPWKAAESLAMGRPLIFERAPLVEMPEPFALIKDIHYLELLPSVGGFDKTAPVENPACYRVLNTTTLAEFDIRAQWLKQVLADRDRIAAMTEQAFHYADRILVAPVIADFICDQVRDRIH